ncbi:MAG: FAD-dependent oxidoreductase, partial [Stellaceae bacterium]
MNSVLLRVTGMICAACAQRVEAALNGLPGVEAQVSFDRKVAEIQSADRVDLVRLIDAVRPHGYGLERLTDDRLRGQKPPSAGGTHIAIVGSGGAAFAAAIRAAEAGARVTMIERGEMVGGTCVNTGCVPSKITLRAAEIRHGRAHHPFDGIARSAEPIDRASLLAQLRGRVDALRSAKYEKIIADNPAITLLRGEARFADQETLVVNDPTSGTTRLTPDGILIAAGAAAMIPPIPGLADTRDWTSSDALFAETLPKGLIVIGSSFVALELAQAYRRLDV